MDATAYLHELWGIRNILNLLMSGRIKFVMLFCRFLLHHRASKFAIWKYLNPSWTILTMMSLNGYDILGAVVSTRHAARRQSKTFWRWNSSPILLPSWLTHHFTRLRKKRSLLVCLGRCCICWAVRDESWKWKVARSVKFLHQDQILFGLFKRLYSHPPCFIRVECASRVRRRKIFLLFPFSLLLEWRE